MSKVLPAVGPLFLGGLALTGPFSRGLVNSFFALLVVWSLTWLFYGRKRWSFEVIPIPTSLLKGLIFFTFTYLSASIFGVDPLRSLKYLADLLYLLATFAAAWLALCAYPKLVGRLPILYAAGLMVTAIIAFQQAEFTLQCVRAKSTIGRIELGIILGQLPPIMLGALALSLDDKKRLQTVIFIVALIASYAAVRTSCSRITMLTLPFFLLIIFWVYRKSFLNVTGLIVIVLVGFGVWASFKDASVVERFADMTKPPAESLNNDMRFKFWRTGIDVFLEHPVFGIGPDSIPNMELSDPKLSARSAVKPKWAHAHNIILTSLAEAGVVGLIGFLVLHLVPIWLLLRHVKSPDPQVKFWVWAAIVINLQFFSNGMTDNIFGNKPMMYIYWTITATCIWVIYSKKDKKTLL
jgi:O-antigen ligase